MNLLTKKDIIAFNQAVGERGELSNESSLDFTLDLIKNKRNWLYEVSYLIRSLLVDHAFQDGNKRTSLLVMSYYLEENKKEYDQPALLNVITKISRRTIRNPVTISRLINHVIKEKN